MVDIEQLRSHIRDEVGACQQRLATFKQELEARQQDLRLLQAKIEEWVDALELENIDRRYDETTHTIEKFDETFELTLQQLTLSFGSCKLHVAPEEQYLHGSRILLYSSADEDDIKEIIKSEDEYYFTELQFGQKRDLSRYHQLTDVSFYKLLYRWLRT
ncbi:hypothetical protein [Salinicola acroporae]|uniref:Uncharacterized protein n=1 Tax=Salinicola acroporae TaxID=1541440 RepID=A0ABT6IA60_9GAMM|nr:hypothetical protein [Salinicola acroporae]MDH4571006.1 hypothetical protein [Salinicola acroporae]MDH4574546.1 hypothetical protein [Salinicola acroporae]